MRVLLALAALAACPPAARTAEPARKPNVVVILADDRDYTKRLIVESSLKIGLNHGKIALNRRE